MARFQSGPDKADTIRDKEVKLGREQSQNKDAMNIAIVPGKSSVWKENIQKAANQWTAKRVSKEMENQVWDEKERVQNC